MRAAIGAAPVLALRLSCDELAPWAGITPEQAPELAGCARLRPWSTTRVRGARSPSSPREGRADVHEPELYNLDVCRAVRADAAPIGWPWCCRGRIVDAGGPGAAGRRGPPTAGRDDPGPARRPGPRGQGAQRSADGRVRPCILCNQTCQVRDGRNPIISCVVDPRDRPRARRARPGRARPPRRPARRAWWSAAARPGSKPLGCSPRARGLRVTVADATAGAGWSGRRGGPGGAARPLAGWPSCERLGVAVRTGVDGAELIDLVEAARRGGRRYRARDRWARRAGHGGGRSAAGSRGGDRRGRRRRRRARCGGAVPRRGGAAGRGDGARVRSDRRARSRWSLELQALGEPGGAGHARTRSSATSWPLRRPGPGQRAAAAAGGRASSGGRCCAAVAAEVVACWRTASPASARTVDAVAVVDCGYRACPTTPPLAGDGVRRRRRRWRRAPCSRPSSRAGGRRSRALDGARRPDLAGDGATGSPRAS